MEFTGKIQYTLKNDYMFKAVLQKNEKVLKGLLASLLHISIIDFRLFGGETVFYSQNRFVDINTHRIYSDKIGLNVLSLKNIEYATREDRECGLCDWARIFAAKTWEELKMIAKNNDLLQEVGKTMEELSDNWSVRLQCEMREYDRKMHQREVEDAFKQGAKEEREKFQEEQEQTQKEIQMLKQKIAQLEAEKKSKISQKTTEK